MPKACQNRILIVTYFYPPLNRMASSRPAYWAQHMRSAGYKADVLTVAKSKTDGPLTLTDTAAPEPIAVNRVLPVGAKTTGPSIIRKLAVKLDSWLTATKVLILLCFSSRFKDYSVIVTTFSPALTLFAGYVLKLKNNHAVWIADYRDAWTGNPYRPMGHSKECLLNLLQKRLLGKCDAVTSVSTELTYQIAQLNPAIPAETIFNGYDRQESTGVAKCSLSRDIGNIEIVYTGTIYPGKRDPTPLLKAIRRMLDQGLISSGQVSVSFYGDRVGDLPNIINENNAASFAFLRGAVSLQQSTSAQANADILLMLGSNDAGILTGKLFEYLAAGRPILAIGDESSSAVGKLLSETNCGKAVGNDLVLIESYILNYISSSSPEFYSPNQANKAKYSRAAQTDKLLALIDKLKNGGSNERNE